MVVGDLLTLHLNKRRRKQRTPSTALRAVPLPRAAGEDSRSARDHHGDRRTLIPHAIAPLTRGGLSRDGNRLRGKRDSRYR